MLKFANVLVDRSSHCRSNWCSKIQLTNVCLRNRNVKLGLAQTASIFCSAELSEFTSSIIDRSSLLSFEGINVS